MRKPPEDLSWITTTTVRGSGKEDKPGKDGWGKPPAWFWPVWVFSGLLTLGFFGLVVWLIILGIKWLEANT